MKILREIELEGKTLQVRKGYMGGTAVVINGEGSYAHLSPAQARALFGALRTLDSEGLLE